jgi:Icc-related predicted phosphoesterase
MWGSPWVKSFPAMNPHCKAFTVDTEEELFEKWVKIPHDVDILITHSPPFTILDKTTDGRQVGSTGLLGLITYAFRPKLWVYGHIHEGYGQEIFKDSTICVNASHVNERYQPVNAPIRIEL